MSITTPTGTMPTATVPATKPRFRFIMKDQDNNQRYLVCRHGIWTLTNGDLVPLSLSTIAGDNAALDDAYEAEDPEMARSALVVLAQFAKNIEFI
jgi:hypothetical protein